MKIAIEVDTSIDGRLNDNAAGIWLIRVISNLKVFSETGRDFREFVFRRLHWSKTARSFDGVFTCRETGLCQDSRQIAVSSGMSGMERLGHGTEHLTKAGGLSC